MIITIAWKYQMGDGTFSDLLVDGAFLCHTVERTSLRLPEGSYELHPHESPKPCLAPFGGRTVAFHNPALGIYAEESMIPAGVHARSLCLIHPANWPDQLLGCVAPGMEIENLAPNGWGVGESHDAFRLLSSMWGDRRGLSAIIHRSKSA